MAKPVVSQSEILPKPRAERRLSADHACFFVVQQTLTRFIERVAQQNNIHHVNLYHHFHGASCNSLHYHFGNNHWNDEEQTKAVDLVSESIREKRLLDSGH